MPEQTIKAIQNWLDEHQAELLENYQKLLQIPSVESEAAPNAPFGQANREALDMALGLGKEWGMEVIDLEGFCGYAEFGSGEKMIGIFGHLDVVPVGPGWKYDPFSATIDNGYVYARGAIDDKGPTIAAFYAARAIKEVVGDPGARIRTVFGCDEESGFECIHRYTKTEEAPTYGIAPDAGWPLIHAEKGIAGLVTDVKFITGGITIKSLTGGQRSNIVIDHAVGELVVSDAARPEIEEKLAKNWDANLSYSWNGNILTVDAKGKAAHGAWPFGGDNAATRVLRFWMEIAPADLKTQFEQLFEMAHVAGDGLGIHGSDDLTDLTANLGVAETTADSLRFTYSVRYPVTWKGENVRAMCEKHLAGLEIAASVYSFTDSKPLYFPLEHPLVKTVVDAYEAETSLKKTPGVMGGGTYARAVPNTVAIGTGWDGDGEAHQTDERCKIEHIFKMSKIYARILYKLTQA